MRAVTAALALVTASPAAAFTLYDEADRSFQFTGYAQPYFRWVDDPCGYTRPAAGQAATCTRSESPDGFGLTRARPIFSGRLSAYSSFHLELRTVPNVELLDLRLHFDLLTDVDDHALRLTVGRFRVPFSRQELTSESRLQLPDRAAFIKSTPGRQLGAAVRYQTGFGQLAPTFLQIEGGLYNGESAKERAPVNNIDSDFLAAARVQISPWGALPTFFEGDLRPLDQRARPMISVGASWTHEVRGAQNGNYRQRRLGGDLLALWHGVSLYAEYYRFDRDYRNDGDTFDPDRHGVGWNVQMGAFVPVTGLEEHLEFAARVESWDPETARESQYGDQLLSPAAGSGPARKSSSQAHRNYVGGLNWYFEGHDLKLQAAYTYRSEIEPWLLSAAYPSIPESAKDDSFRLQLTYRF